MSYIVVQSSLSSGIEKVDHYLSTLSWFVFYTLLIMICEILKSSIMVRLKEVICEAALM